MSARFLAALGAVAAVLVASTTAQATCDSGSVFVTSANQCQCDYGYTPTGSFNPSTGSGCEACPDTFTTYNYGSSSCVCDGTSGFIADPDDSTQCNACPQNSANSVYGFNGACVTCDPTNSFDTVHGCVCASGSYGAYTADGSAPSCTSCPTGYTTTAFPSGGASSASDCQCDSSQGYTLQGGVCTKCAADQHPYNGNCLTCPGPSSVFVDGQGCVAAVGYYGSQTSTGEAPAGGFTKCGANMLSNQGSTLASQCFCDTDDGYINVGGSCIQCPSGSNAFTPAGGVAKCLTCDSSSLFDPSQGCICNSGFYGTTSTTGVSSCSACPDHSVSFVGAQTQSDCSCDASNGYMDNGSGSCVIATTPSMRARARRAFEIKRRAAVARSQVCPASQTACPIGHLGNFECLDVSSQVDSCGGCVSLGQGVDCTSIEGVSGVGCEAGKCVVFSCAEGFRLQDGECVA